MGRPFDDCLACSCLSGEGVWHTDRAPTPKFAKHSRILRPTLPVLFASGYYERDLLEAVRARDSAAATESIVKPYDFKLLAQRLSELAG